LPDNHAAQQGEELAMHHPRDGHRLFASISDGGRTNERWGKTLSTGQILDPEIFLR
jgi:hypothetical protein